MNKINYDRTPGDIESAEIREAVRLFASAASHLSNLWQHHQHNPDGSSTWVDDVLTATYPPVIGMSFDEYTAELWAWDENLADALELHDDDELTVEADAIDAATEAALQTPETGQQS